MSLQAAHTLKLTYTHTQKNTLTRTHAGKMTLSSLHQRCAAPQFQLLVLFTLTLNAPLPPFPLPLPLRSNKHLASQPARPSQQVSWAAAYNEALECISVCSGSRSGLWCLCVGGSERHRSSPRAARRHIIMKFLCVQKSLPLDVNFLNSACTQRRENRVPINKMC